MYHALASVAESRTPGLLSVIPPPAEVLAMPRDKLQWIERVKKRWWKLKRDRSVNRKDRVCPRILCQNPLLTAEALLLNLAQQSLELSVILMT